MWHNLLLDSGFRHFSEVVAGFIGALAEVSTGGRFRGGKLVRGRNGVGCAAIGRRSRAVRFGGHGGALVEETQRVKLEHLR
jgi:hypothetical protein